MVERRVQGRTGRILEIGGIALIVARFGRRGPAGRWRGRRRAGPLSPAASGRVASRRSIRASPPSPGDVEAAPGRLDAPGRRLRAQRLGGAREALASDRRGDVGERAGRRAGPGRRALLTAARARPSGPSRPRSGWAAAGAGSSGASCASGASGAGCGAGRSGGRVAALRLVLQVLDRALDQRLVGAAQDHPGDRDLGVGAELVGGAASARGRGSRACRRRRRRASRCPRRSPSGSRSGGCSCSGACSRSSGPWRRRRAARSRRARRGSARGPRRSRPRPASRGSSRSPRSRRSRSRPGRRSRRCARPSSFPCGFSWIAAAGAGTSPTVWSGGTLSGCSRCASSSVPSTRRGPGRENEAAASTANTRSAPSASICSRGRSTSRRARCASQPQGIATTTSGLAAASSSHVGGAGLRARRARARRCRPPISIISGIQWPPTKGGSSHSSASTRGRGAPATASRTAASRSSSDGAQGGCRLGGIRGVAEAGHVGDHVGEAWRGRARSRRAGSAAGPPRRARRRRRRRRPRRPPGSRSGPLRGRAGRPRRARRARARPRPPRGPLRRSRPASRPSGMMLRVRWVSRCRLGWEVALMGDADDPVAEPEGEEHLGR